VISHDQHFITNVCNEIWLIKISTKHTTVINDKQTMIFDVLYYDENDSTFGGEQALLDACIDNDGDPSNFYYNRDDNSDSDSDLE
jgi:ATPase subunit of ABC transporter with duplicated ATPase domains